jgi:hypothetical protein
MVMKSVFRLVFTFLLLGMTGAYAQAVDKPEAKPFHISSRGSAYGAQGEFEGTYRINDSSIEVYVSKATLYVSEHCCPSRKYRPAFKCLHLEPRLRVL